MMKWPAARMLLFAIVSIALPLHAQTQRPQATFCGGTDLVQVDVSVFDNKRHPVRGLKPEDFAIFEDGQPREIQAFTEVNLPDRVVARDASWTRDVPSDVVTNQAGQEEGPLVVILLDRTIPVGEPTTTAKRIATAAINQLGPGDHYVSLPLGTLAPGDYLLKVEARMGARVAGRALRFIVRQ